MGEVLAITPGWAGVILTAVSTTIAAAIYVGKQIFATKAEVTEAEARLHERRERSEEHTRASFAELTETVHRIDTRTARIEERGNRS